jgi:glycosyltransferase involved in cell wall biosynthesis
MDLVIVPSEFVKEVFANSGEVKTKVVVIPEAFIDAVATPELSEIDLELKTDFNFLVFGQITGNNPENDRKNIFYTVKWLAEQFKDNPDVGIVLKTNTGRHTVVDRMRTTNMMAQLTMEIKKGAEFPKFYLLHGDMTDDEVASRYRHPKIKALVAPTRGEGFGLPLFEAAGYGLPIITTDWSGHTDFMYCANKEGKVKPHFARVDFVLQPVQPEAVWEGVIEKDTIWAFSVANSAKMQMREVYKNHDRFRGQAKRLAINIEKQFATDNIYKQFIDIITKEERYDLDNWIKNFNEQQVVTHG